MVLRTKLGILRERLGFGRVKSGLRCGDDGNGARTSAIKEEAESSCDLCALESRRLSMTDGGCKREAEDAVSHARSEAASWTEARYCRSRGGSARRPGTRTAADKAVRRSQQASALRRRGGVEVVRLAWAAGWR